MLVIRRRAGETLLIGDSTEIEILECSGSHVKLGIRAPKEISILRKEVHLTAQQNRAAARDVSSAVLRRLIGTLNGG